MPRPCHIATLNEGAGGKLRLVQPARLELALLDPQVLDEGRVPLESPSFVPFDGLRGLRADLTASGEERLQRFSASSGGVRLTVRRIAVGVALPSDG